MNYYAVVKKVCFTLAIVVFIAGYLSLAFDRLVTYVPPQTNIPPQVNPQTATVYTWRIPDTVVEGIVREYVHKKTKLIALVDLEYEKGIAEAKEQQAKARQRISEAKAYAAATPFEQRMSEADLKQEYFVYSVSALFNPEAGMDATSYIIGPNHELEEKYIKSFTARIFIGYTEAADDKIGACIRNWKQTQVRPFNVILVTDISREFNF